MSPDGLQVEKMKNQKRLRHLKFITFLLGINITAPSTFKDALRVITIIILISNGITIYGQLRFIIHFRHSIAIIAECIMLMLQTLISDFKMIYLLFVQFRFYKILHRVETHEVVDKIEYLSEETSINKDLRKEVQTILSDCWSSASRKLNFYIFACTAIVGYYIFNSQLSNFYNWYIGNKNYTNIFPHPVLFEHWEEKRNELPYYLIMTLIIGCSNVICGTGAVSFDGMFIFIALHCVALVRILKKMILHSTSGQVAPNMRVRVIRECIDHYERTFRFCEEFNNLYFHISLLQFLLSLVILGVMMFQASVGLEGDKTIVVRMIFYMMAAGFEVVIYCFNGQLVSNEFDELPFAWFDCEWYNESKEFRRLIKMMIMRTNRGFIMNASWFSTLSLPTFLALAKTSGSYFLLLRGLND